ncbi:coenzyme Q-binding protein COQ10 mitochondrial [Tripterygium wilfordii]|uniref:Coenzyme Q-binding protein COQ10 mitochondrial n=1 Tax=Tripterygium wilfordii TaxID=458696 RepID=A0A7J7DLT9_TRIWF|nr:coenzyme Q-binding protein COQ10 homolog, mitochondrial [Tripterygium wilfordii]XP_038702988.1 coenzyme Q-binding protein COQ10 homolog, mitochondrial [Tripterygium wilfordii]KAF5747046.1 coenzyme Q-binding protein COQ10 mitochondrial [Tripterygium wilfordii]
MPPLMSGSRAFGSVLSRKKCVRHLIRSCRRDMQLQKFDVARCISGITGIQTPSIHNPVKDVNCSIENFCNRTSFVQKRQFLGCGDGEEGSVLSKVYEERRVLGYSPEQLFDVVAAVDLYHGFVPWCQRSEVLKHYPDGSFDAELEIGFKFLVESYVSHVELDRPKFIKTTASQSSLFDHLINIWEFNPGPVPGSCDIHFLVDFKFQSPLYRQVASMFFKEVVSRLVSSFSDRCRLIYGPGVRVLERPYGQGA